MYKLLPSQALASEKRENDGKEQKNLGFITDLECYLHQSCCLGLRWSIVSFVATL